MLAEKLETVIARATLNTRMRDFYDIHILWSERAEVINVDTLRNAIVNVARKRETIKLFDNINEILDDIIRSGKNLSCIPETYSDGEYTAHSDSYVEVKFRAEQGLSGKIVSVKPVRHEKGVIIGEITK